MNNAKYRRYYLLSLAGVIVACAYPLYMGISVVLMMIRDGAIPYKEYPKYVIPYAPIALAVIAGVAAIPAVQKLTRKAGLLFGTLLSLAVFFPAELLMETKVLVQTDTSFPLGSWQMSLCYVPPEMYESRTWEAVDILLGGYSPAFKLHFYLISVVIILSLLNCFYGFADIIRTGCGRRKKALTVQAVTAAAFLGMCVWACFTAFYRTGDIVVPRVSAALMSVFFALIGIVSGVFAFSFTVGKKNPLPVLLPPAVSVLATVAMYIGEMILLSGNLYRFGHGFLFDGLGRLVLAPVDFIIIAASGGITFLICRSLTNDPEYSIQRNG